MQNSENGGSDHYWTWFGWKVDIYIAIWVILLALTLGEVFYAFLPLSKMMLALGLIAMAIWKAALVGLYYMHLRYEPRNLWILAISPLPLAFIMVLAIITEFGWLVG
ncbi:MAG: cytochrome C oxidase subunit IV family protein [Gemmatimonadetes bacterium]|jgi:cytochrome c oxidase subunit 4|nr:cytochrome C oxidase subunit IV family protein [Gemmatimonadota bacterium]|tara:strand:+ start:19 stop:339 length:321 start_codon:yes stop_codon:yes gene_type:complete